MKTKKKAKVALNEEIKKALELWKNEVKADEEQYIFKSRKGKNRPISRNHAYRIIKSASTELQTAAKKPDTLDDKISDFFMHE